MPYIWSIGNQIEIILEKKRFLKRKDIITVKQFPVDHMGDDKYTIGKCVMAIKAKLTKNDLQINQEVILENVK